MEQAQQSIRVHVQSIGQIPLLSPDEQLALAKRVRERDEAARALMIRANLRLVVAVTRDYAQAGLPLFDLISEGNVGLTTAVDRFDPARGVPFSAYATWWIEHAIKRALNHQGKTVRLPRFRPGPWKTQKAGGWNPHPSPEPIGTVAKSG